MNLYYVVADWHYSDGCGNDNLYGFNILSVCENEKEAKNELAKKYKELKDKYNSFTKFGVYMKNTDDHSPIDFEDQMAKFGIFNGEVYDVEESNRRLEKFLKWKNPMDKYRRGGW